MIKSIKSLYYSKNSFKESVKYSINGNECYIDKGIYKCVEVINNYGIKTKYSCQGILEPKDYYRNHQSFSFIILEEGEKFPIDFIEQFLNEKDFMIRGKYWIQTFDFYNVKMQIDVNKKFIKYIENYFKS